MDASAKAMRELPWWMYGVIEELPSETCGWPQVKRVEVLHCYVREWAFPLLLLYDVVERIRPHWSEWPALGWQIVMRWAEFLHDRPEFEIRVFLYRGERG